jgi:hypothetical protein
MGLIGRISSLPKLFKDRWILNFGVAGQKDHFADHLGCPGVVVREGEKQPAPVLGVDRHQAECSAGQPVYRSAPEVDAVVAKFA